MSPLPPLLPEYVPEVDLWMERSNLVGIIIAGVAYGILFTLFVQCIMALRLQTGHRKGQAMWFQVYCCLVFALASVGFGTNIKFIQMTYVDYRNYPGGPNAFTFDLYNHPVNMVVLVAYIFMNWLVDGLMVYRFATIYNYHKLAMIVPCIIYLGIIGTSLAFLAFTMKPGGGFFMPTTVDIGTAYWSLSIAMNLIITAAITGRLLKMRSNIRKVLGPTHSSTYTSVLSMVIESAALYTAWATVFMVTYAKEDVFQNIVLPSLGQIQAIAPLLIIFRVAQGKAWTSSTGTATGTNTIGGSIPRARGPNQTRSHGMQSYPMTEVTDTTLHFDIEVEKSVLHTTDAGMDSESHPRKVVAL